MLLRPRLDAHEALEAGLVTEVVAEGKALERALELAARLAELPALAVAVAKEAADAAAGSSREAGLLIERLAYAMLAQTEDAQAAAADAFVAGSRASKEG
jgi:enoyl-CoA hydratase